LFTVKMSTQDDCFHVHNVPYSTHETN
jgi:hypothetical protein